MRPASKTNQPLLGTCDACRRNRQRIEWITREGIDLQVCLNYQACIAATPPVDVIARGEGGVPS